MRMDLLDMEELERMVETWGTPGHKMGTAQIAELLVPDLGARHGETIGTILTASDMTNLFI